jgi:hypothetical protein
MDTDETYNKNEAVIILIETYNSWMGTKEESAYLLKLYLLACAKNIWQLLPMEESRNGIEVVEKYMAGLVSDEEFHYAEYCSEGAAFAFDYYDSKLDFSSFTNISGIKMSEDEINKYVKAKKAQNKEIRKYVNELKSLPEDELEKLVFPGDVIKKFTPRKLLTNAAYFAHFAMIFPTYKSLSTTISLFGYPIPEEYIIFFSPSVLREVLLM